VVTSTSTRRRRTKVRRTRGRRTGIVLGWVLLGCVALVAVAGVWTAVDALRVRDQLVEAAGVVPQLEDQVLAGDDDAVATSVATLREAASSAVTTTGRPHWTLTSWLPGVGPNVRAVQMLAGTVSDLAEGPLPSLPAVVAAASPAALAPQDGRVDVHSVAEAAPVVIAADDGVNAAIESLEAIDRSALLPQVSDAVDQLSDELTDLRLSTATASRAVQLIPPMMGIDGPRDYLVLVQNNAEPRALGGIVGSVLVLRADGGSIELVEQVAGNSISFDEPVGDLTDSERAIFGTQLGRFMLNVTSTPDFPRAAQLASDMWVAERGETPAGVLSLDPVALAGLLGATGPVTTDAGLTLTSDDAAQYLLNQIYLDEPDPARQDVFFADAAASIFSALSGGSGDAQAAVSSLVSAGDDGRLMLWSSDPAEQALLDGTQLAGEVLADAASPVVGVYLNDGSGAKIGYYLEVDTSLAVSECRPDGSQRLRLDIDLASTVPDPRTLPAYLTGGGAFVPEGTIQTNLAVYGPSGGRIVGVSGPEGEMPVLTQRQGDTPVSLVTVTLDPAESMQLELELVTGKQVGGPPTLRTTPGPRATVQTIEPGCAATS
jgi:Protein of unknown function (DUF4012)